VRRFQSRSLAPVGKALKKKAEDLNEHKCFGQLWHVPMQVINMDFPLFHLIHVVTVSSSQLKGGGTVMFAVLVPTGKAPEVKEWKILLERSGGYILTASGNKENEVGLH
jgi:hypothetical protein